MDQIIDLAPLVTAPRLIEMQRAVLDCPVPLRPLYWKVIAEADDDLIEATPTGLSIPAGAAVSFETYFGAMFERPWRTHTRAGVLHLVMRLEGQARLQVWRRSPDTGRALLVDQLVEGRVRIALPQDTPHPRQAGLLWFELTAQDGGLTLRDAAWHCTVANPAAAAAPVAIDEAPRLAPARLAIVICTFDREAELSCVLGAIAATEGLETAVARIIVVNQGRPDLLDHPGIAPEAARLGRRLRVIEQANLGGAGGFGRGLLEALDDPSATHVCFLDDDVRLEPESLRRMAAFFTLARGNIALGGHMLDSVRPTTLYEAGARIGGNGNLQPLHHGLDLAAPDSLQMLQADSPMHYNGWWMFGFPKALTERVGLPLPCFIRGDDVEYGLRLHDRGIPTVPLPGVGIWHEPFYLKIGGWQLYYEVRNALVCSALHESFQRNQVAILCLKRLLTYLLTYRYAAAALVVRAMQDFARGPAVLDADPRPLHAEVVALRALHPVSSIPRERVVPGAALGRARRGRAMLVLLMVRALLHNALRPTRPDAPPAAMPVHDLVWFRLLHTDAAAADTHWDAEIPVFRRDRARFRSLFAAGLRAIMALRREAPALQRSWQAAAPHLSSRPFWQSYVRTGR